MAYYAPFYQPSYMQGNQFNQQQQFQTMQYQQPVQAMPQQPMMNNSTPQNNNGLIWVQGEAGAKSYLVAPGNTVMLMDSEGERFFIKSADASGMPLPLRIFDYKERTEMSTQAAINAPATSNNINLDNFITREEFEQRLAVFAQPVTNKKPTAKIKEETDNG